MSYQGLLSWNLKKLFLYLTSAPSYFFKCVVQCKTKRFQVWAQKFLILFFSGCNFKKLLPYFKSALSNLPKRKVFAKIKILSSLTQILSSLPLNPYLHDGGLCHIETRSLIFITNQWTGFYVIETSVMKELNLRPKMSCMSIFGLHLKRQCKIRNQHPPPSPPDTVHFDISVRFF